MPIITLSNLTKSFGARELFAGVSLAIDKRERVALIGANGTGKTTLLKIICGEERADGGSVNTEPGISVGYLPQDVDLPDAAGLHIAVMGVTPELQACAIELAELEREASAGDHTRASHYAEVSHRFDTLGGFDYQIRAKAILLGLGFEESEFEKPVRSLSGGQKTRAALARLLLLDPDILLLDEPTNHLDIQACEWLQEFLQTRFHGAALIVSHDRYFMDRVVDKVVELDGGTAFTYPGNYSAFARLKAAKIEEQQKAYKEQQKEITRIETAIQTLFSDRKFSRRDSKVKELERIQRIGSVRDQKTIKVRIQTAARSGRDVVRLRDLTKSYPGKDLFADMNFVAERGRKIGIVGPNGSGKTTLLRIIAERETADRGEVILGHNVRPVYFAQEFDHLSPDRTVVEELLADADLTAKEARDMLARFLFMGDDAFKKVEVLSGGELCRLALAKVLAAGPNLLLLDEPTNHLDIASREALEDALRGFNGTVLTASHDRYLLDAIANEIIEIKDGAWGHYLGNYTSYHEKTRPKPPVEESGNGKARAKVVAPPVKERPVTALRQRERAIRDLTKRQKQLEDDIHTTEARLVELTEALTNADNYRSGSARDLSLDYDEQSARLTALYAEWEQVCEELADAETSSA
jgi:ATP-binding cassette subfamily F protein 3